MIGLGVGSSYALFIVTRYRQNLRDEHRSVALDSALQAPLRVKPWCSTGITVAIALLGLWISGIAFVGMMATTAAMTCSQSPSSRPSPCCPGRSGASAGNAIDKLTSTGKRRHPPRRRAARRTSRKAGGARRKRLASSVILATGSNPGAGGHRPAAVLDETAGSRTNGSAPASETRRPASDLLSEGFGPGFNGPCCWRSRSTPGRAAGARRARGRPSRRPTVWRQSRRPRRRRRGTPR